MPDTLLFAAPHAKLSPAAGVEASAARFDVHRASMELRDEIRSRLTPETQQFADAIVIAGMISAIARILEESSKPFVSAILSAALPSVLANEQAFWAQSGRNSRRRLLH